MIIVTAVVMASGFYSMSQMPPDRTLNIVTYALILLFVTIAIAAKASISKSIIWLIIPLFISSFLLIKSTYSHWNEVKLEIKSEMETIINNIKPVGQLDGFIENKGWVAACVASYYGIEMITILEE